MPEQRVLGQRNQKALSMFFARNFIEVFDVGSRFESPGS